jgi:hypothetical protein
MNASRVGSRTSWQGTSREQRPASRYHLWMKVRDVLKRLAEDGYADVPVGTLKNILKTAGLD